MMSISISTASGHGEGQDEAVHIELINISIFIRYLHRGRDYKPSFPPLPQLIKSTDEQIEEEGGNEEVEAQLCNNGQRDNIKEKAIQIKATILNHFIDISNTRPWWYR
ncbi:MAG: hypothetical protein EZS28_042757 [Streblomastix strix]|uniref:Uncharacterized protein n=1 Tax=Streblomastix strix TaxID=222440 RepID=A0A5J4TTZ9_9EUKA|nr:MAG: hypothetical protein EZS28_042757 [Streblomastix strix]